MSQLQFATAARIKSTTARIGTNLTKSLRTQVGRARIEHFRRRGRAAMRKLCCRSMAAIVLLMVTGCGPQKPVVDSAAAVAQLSTGAPLLSCRADCVAEWRRAQPHAAQLDAAARWSELAALVITINYQDDLTLYYLGRAAEGLGYPAAAVSYYRQSTYISGSSLSCQHESGVCAGVVLPDVALARIDALESQARRSRFQPRRQPAKPPPAGSKPLPSAEPKPQALAPAEREPQQPGAAETGPLQPTSPISQPRDTTATATAPDGRGTPPPAQPMSPQPTRVDPVATQFIEPPAAR
jgi:hypothetical protein